MLYAGCPVEDADHCLPRAELITWASVIVSGNIEMSSSSQGFDITAQAIVAMRYIIHLVLDVATILEEQRC